MLFFVYCLSIDGKSFFGTYALDISSLTSSLKYISEKYNNLLCFLFFFIGFLHNLVGFPAFPRSVRSPPRTVGTLLTAAP